MSKCGVTDIRSAFHYSSFISSGQTVAVCFAYCGILFSTQRYGPIYRGDGEDNKGIGLIYGVCRFAVVLILLAPFYFISKQIPSTLDIWVLYFVKSFIPYNLYAFLVFSFGRKIFMTIGLISKSQTQLDLPNDFTKLDRESEPLLDKKWDYLNLNW